MPADRPFRDDVATDVGRVAARLAGEMWGGRWAAESSQGDLVEALTQSIETASSTRQPADIK